MNARDLANIGKQATDTLKTLPKTQSQNQSPIRAMSTIKIKKELGNVLHGSQDDKHILRTLEARGSHDPSMYTSRQAVSPPPRIDTLDGLLTMRESQDSI